MTVKLGGRRGTRSRHRLRGLSPALCPHEWLPDLSRESGTVPVKALRAAPFDEPGTRRLATLEIFDVGRDT
jgi:hypothetical protein